MKAAVLRSAGSTPVYADFPDPDIGDGEVFVKGRASSIKRIDRGIASGQHYLKHETFPLVVGVDGIGELADGQRVYFGGVRAPYGAMAEAAPARQGFLIPLEVDIDDTLAAALPNAAMSSWLPLQWHAKLQPGETVLILGATGSSGQLALQVAKHLGADRIVVAGRNRTALDALLGAGADAAISLTGEDDEVIEAFREAGGDAGYDVVLDYLWAKPLELFGASLMAGKVDYTRKQTRLVQVGNMAGPDATVPANLLRSTGLRLMGSGAGSVDPREILLMIPEVWKLAAAGTLTMAIEEVPLADIETAWQRGDRDGRRQVVRISG